MKLTVGKHVATLYFDYNLLFSFPMRNTTTCIIEYKGVWGKGVAICHPKDNYSVTMGKKVAFRYAVEDLVPQLFRYWTPLETLVAVRSAFWGAYLKWTREHEHEHST